MSGGIGLSAADADRATIAATAVNAPFRKTPFGEANLGKNTFEYSLTLQAAQHGRSCP
jgi:hypothetical protein